MTTDQSHSGTGPILTQKQEGVTTLKMNTPARLNGWTRQMMDALRAGLDAAARDDETRVLVLTGADPYYCAGVNLSGALPLGHPRKMHATIVENNEALFNLFLDFPKPILVAVNGPAIGASVTSATLCDGIVASEKATFSTPFAALGVTPEGCSSVLFARLMGEESAGRMLGPEGWRPGAREALDAGLIQWVVPHDQLPEEAQRIAGEWIDTDAQRSFRGGSTRDELKAVNARESVELADAFLGAAFIKAQFKFLASKKKWGPAALFLAMLISRPVWSRLL
ncbi:MAG: enoyl-CoA hydratase/isomerase family protein [Xanthomonadales bacterium]|nr:enoyl-CoA hydratase/isomerase family protein [Gammaproteobacteria bacterium]MBT8053770.1 enoyl-CoA hydratase/isomerase family protein [Gammaproteobacteria bacterium]NNK51607.1 enoyl-CoA hydratase/isomerase family protein [Xanthomonadales bacterium]